MSVNNFILETASAPGTNTTFSLLGNAAGRLSFASRYSSGATPYYFMDDGVQSEWGIGTFTAGSPNTLARTTVVGNTALNTSRLNFAGTVRIYNDIPAEKMIFLSAAGAANVAGDIVATKSGYGSVTVKPQLTTRTPVQDDAQIYSQLNVAGSGGVAANVAFNGRFYSSITGAPNIYIWSLIGVVDYSGTGGGTAEHVGVYGQAVRRVVNAGGAANNPKMWGMTIGFNDLTATNSTATNYSIGLEVDMSFNDLDGADTRQGIIMVVNRVNPAGAATQVGIGLGFTSGTIQDHFKKVIDIGSTYSTAGLDLRTGLKLSGHSIWMGDNHDIAMDNAGLNTIYWDPAAISAAGATRFSGNVEFDGATVYLPAATVIIGGIAQIAANRGLVFGSQTNGAGASAGTLTNAPAAGNPAFWVPIVVNGTNRWFPVW